MMIMGWDQQRKLEGDSPNFLQRLHQSNIMDRLQQCNQPTNKQDEVYGRWNRQQNKGSINEYLNCLLTMCRFSEQLSSASLKERNFCSRLCLQIVCFFLRFTRETGKPAVDTLAMLKNAQLLLFAIDKTSFRRFARDVIKAINTYGEKFESELNSRLLLEANRQYSHEDYQLSRSVECENILTLVFKLITNVMKTMEGLKQKLSLVEAYLRLYIEQILRLEPNVLTVYINTIEQADDEAKLGMLDLLSWQLLRYKSYEQCYGFLVYCLQRVSSLQIFRSKHKQGKELLLLFKEFCKDRKFVKETSLLQNTLVVSVQAADYTWVSNVLSYWLGTEFHKIDIVAVGKAHEKGMLLFLAYMLVALDRLTPIRSYEGYSNAINGLRKAFTADQSLFLRKPSSNELYFLSILINRLNHNKDQLLKTVERYSNIEPLCETGLPAELRQRMLNIDLQCVLIEGLCLGEQARDSRRFLLSGYYLLIVSTLIEFISSKHPCDLLGKALHELFAKYDNLASDEELMKNPQKHAWLESLGYLCASAFYKCNHIEYWDKVSRMLLRLKILDKMEPTHSIILRELLKGLKCCMKEGNQRQIVVAKDLTMIVMRQSAKILRRSHGDCNTTVIEAYSRSQICVLVNNNHYQQDELSEVDNEITQFYKVQTHPEQALKTIGYYLCEQLLRLVLYRLYSVVSKECKPKEVVPAKPSKHRHRKPLSIPTFLRVFDVYYQCYTARQRQLSESDCKKCYIHHFEFTSLLIGQFTRYSTMLRGKSPAGTLLKQIQQTLKRLELSQVHSNGESPLVFFKKLQDSVRKAPHLYSFEDIVHVYAKLTQLLLHNRPPEDWLATPKTISFFPPPETPQQKEPEPHSQDNFVEEMCIRSQHVLPLMALLREILTTKMLRGSQLVDALSLFKIENLRIGNSFEILLLLRDLETLVQVAVCQGDVATFHTLLNCKLSILAMFDTSNCFDMLQQQTKLHLLQEISKYAKQYPLFKCFVQDKIVSLSKGDLSKEANELINIIKIRCGLLDHNSVTNDLSNELKSLVLLNYQHLSVPLGRHLVLSFCGTVYRYFNGTLRQLAVGDSTRNTTYFTNPVHSEHMRANKESLMSTVTATSFASALGNYDYDEDCHRLLPELLVDVLETMYRHGQKSEMQAFEEFALTYLCRTNNIRLATRLLRLFVGKEEIVDFGKVYDGLVGVLEKLYPLHKVDSVREILFNKRKSMSAKYTIAKLSKNLQRMASDVDINRTPLAKDLVVLMLKHYSYVHEEIPFRCDILLRELEGKRDDLDRMLQECSDGSLSMQHLTRTLKQLLCKVMECSDNYQEALSYFGAYGWVDSLVTNLLSEKQSLCDPFEVDEYCNGRNFNYLRLALHVMDYNYQFKRMSFSTPKYQNSESSDIKAYLQTIIALHHNFKGRQPAEEKIEQIFTRLTDPLCVVLPFGNRLINIAVHNQIITCTSVPLNSFMDPYRTFQELIRKNEIEMRKPKHPADWWKSRERINRQIGKIVQSSNVGVFPRKIKKGQQLSQRQDSLVKQYGSAINDLLTYSRSINYVKLGIYAAAIRQYTQFSSYYRKLSRPERESIVQQLVEDQRSIDYDHSNAPMLLYAWVDLRQFPFECIDTSDYETMGVYRVPSAAYILEQNCSRRNVNINDLSYLINPGLDLKNTVNSFNKISKDFVDWNGIVSRSPTHQEFLDLLRRQVFLYMGHGSGSQYLPEPLLFEKEVRSAALLFGCSSAKMQHKGSQACGIAHTYLLASCPVVLGCLWDVTDVDTDGCTDRIFKAVRQKRNDLSRIVEHSKRQCKMEFLNGSAMVLYGMPCTVFTQ